MKFFKHKKTIISLLSAASTISMFSNASYGVVRATAGDANIPTANADGEWGGRDNVPTEGDGINLGHALAIKQDIRLGHINVGADVNITIAQTAGNAAVNIKLGSIISDAGGHRTGLVFVNQAHVVTLTGAIDNTDVNARNKNNIYDGLSEIQFTDLDGKVIIDTGNPADTITLGAKIIPGGDNKGTIIAKSNITFTNQIGAANPLKQLDIDKSTVKMNFVDAQVNKIANVNLLDNNSTLVFDSSALLVNQAAGFTTTKIVGKDEKTIGKVKFITGLGTFTFTGQIGKVDVNKTYKSDIDIITAAGDGNSVLKLHEVIAETIAIDNKLTGAANKLTVKVTESIRADMLKYTSNNKSLNIDVDNTKHLSLRQIIGDSKDITIKFVGDGGTLENTDLGDAKLMVTKNLELSGSVTLKNQVTNINGGNVVIDNSILTIKDKASVYNLGNGDVFNVFSVVTTAGTSTIVGGVNKAITIGANSTLRLAKGTYADVKYTDNTSNLVLMSGGPSKDEKTITIGKLAGTAGAQPTTIVKIDGAFVNLGAKANITNIKGFEFSDNGGEITLDNLVDYTVTTTKDGVGGIQLTGQQVNFNNDFGDKDLKFEYVKFADNAQIAVLDGKTVYTALEGKGITIDFQGNTDRTGDKAIYGVGKFDDDISTTIETGIGTKTFNLSNIEGQYGLGKEVKISGNNVDAHGIVAKKVVFDGTGTLNVSKYLAVEDFVLAKNGAKLVVDFTNNQKDSSGYLFGISGNGNIEINCKEFVIGKIGNSNQKLNELKFQDKGNYRLFGENFLTTLELGKDNTFKLLDNTSITADKINGDNVTLDLANDKLKLATDNLSLTGTLKLMTTYNAKAIGTLEVKSKNAVNDKINKVDVVVDIKDSKSRPDKGDEFDLFTGITFEKAALSAIDKDTTRGIKWKIDKFGKLTCVEGGGGGSKKAKEIHELLLKRSMNMKVDDIDKVLKSMENIANNKNVSDQDSKFIGKVYKSDDAEVISNAIAGVAVAPKAAIELSNGSTIDNISEVSEIISSRIDNLTLGVSSGDDHVPFNLWSNVYGGKTKQKVSRNILGYENKYVGVIVGADAQVNDRTTIGAAFSFTNGKIKHKGYINELNRFNGNKTDLKNYILYLYGKYDLGNDFSIQGIFFGGNSNAKDKVNKAIDLDNNKKFVTKAVSKRRDTSIYGAKGFIEYKYNADSFFIIPRLGITYTRLNNSGYNKVQYNDAEAVVNSKSINSFVGTVGVTLTGTIQTGNNIQITPEVHAFLNGNLTSKKHKTVVIVPAYGINYESGIKPVKASYNVGGSVKIKTNDTIDVGFALDANLRKKFRGFQGSLNLTVKLF